MSKNILFLTEAFGSGHTNAAEALKQSIAVLEPSIRMHMIDPSKLLHPNTRTFFLHSYKKMINNYPYLWKIIYHHASPPHVVQSIIYYLFHRNLDQVLQHFKPDLIVCTHPFTSSSLARLKRAGGHPLRICTVITDLHVHRVWVQSEVDLYIVSHKEVQQQLIDFGVSPKRIAVTGMPVRMNFWQKNNKIEARKKLKIHHMPTIIIMGGGWGIGKMKEIALSLLKWKDSIQLLICTGSNARLKTSLSQNKTFQHPHIIISGYVDHIDRWFDAADLIITKPGGITIFEALTKGVPLLLYDPIPGQEEYNCNHFVNSKLAVKMNHMRELDDWMEKLLFKPSEFEPWIARIRQFQQEIHPLASAKSILQLLDCKHSSEA